MKEKIRFNRVVVIWMVLFVIYAMDSYPKEILVSQLTENQQQELKAQIRESIQLAEKLFEEEKYAEAFRVLYDAHRKEEEVQFSDNAGYKIYKMSLSLIHNGQSQLIQHLRNIEVSVQEKSIVLTELQALAEKKINQGQTISVQGEYTGPLMCIVTSSQLTTEEKEQIIRYVMFEIREHYISKEQKLQMQHVVEQELDVAHQKFLDRQYDEAFRLMFDSCKKEEEAGINNEQMGQASNVLSNRLYSITYADESPLMHFFRNQDIPLSKKQRFLSELEALAKGYSIQSDGLLAQGNYTGTLVKLMSSTLLNTDEKLIILSFIQEAITDEFSPIP